MGCQRLGLAMRTWVEVWRAAERGAIEFVPSRRSGAGPVAADRAAKPPAHAPSGHAPPTALPKIVTVAFAADSRYLPKLLAVVERLRAMKHGKVGTFPPPFFVS